MSQLGVKPKKKELSLSTSVEKCENIFLQLSLGNKTFARVTLRVLSKFHKSLFVELSSTLGPHTHLIFLKPTSGKF